MENFSKVVRLGTLPYTAYPRHRDPVETRMSVYAKVKYTDGCLSITGVEGPTGGGHCKGSCGQIVMSLTEPGGLDGFQPAPAWTREMVDRFLAVWDEWHLNDMRPYNAEMKAAGWDKLAATPMDGYEYSLTSESWACKRAAEAAAQDALRAGQTFTPTPAQVAAAVLPMSLKIWQAAGEPAPVTPDGYERSKHISGHNGGTVKHPERKTLGWLSQKDHPDGLLSRKLNPTDKEGYGDKWWREDVPADVLAFLAGLPDTDTKPAWV